MGGTLLFIHGCMHMLNTTPINANQLDGVGGYRNPPVIIQIMRTANANVLLDMQSVFTK